MRQNSNYKEISNNILEPILQQTSHSRKRTAQRGIKLSWIDIVYSAGNYISKQGLRFFYMNKRDIKNYSPEMQKHLQGLILVVSEDETLVTCYRNGAYIKDIKRKSKRLYKRSSMDIN